MGKRWQDGAFVIRGMREQDITALRDVLGRAFESPRLGERVAGDFTAYCRLGENTQLLEEQVDLASPAEHWAVEEVTTGRLVGTVGLYRFRWAWSKSLWLGWLALDPEYQKLGLGRAMVETAMRVARGKGAEVLKVETDRGGAAIAFYEALGFSLEGVISQHYGAGADAVVLSCDLANVEALEQNPIHSPLSL